MSTYLHRTRTLAAAALLALAVAFGLVTAQPAYAENATGGGDSQLVVQEMSAQENGVTTYELTPINDESMYVVVKAVLEDYEGDGQDYLTYYLNGTSYGYGFSGSQDEAVASWDSDQNSPKAGHENAYRWASGESATISSTYKTSKGTSETINDELKMGYRIPISIPASQTVFSIPVVAYASDFTARRLDIDLTGRTATTGSATDTATVTFNSQVNDVSIATGSTPTLTYTGYVRPYAGNMNTSKDPLSNNFTGSLSFKLSSANDVYDQVYAVTYAGKPWLGDTAVEQDPVAADYASVSTDGSVVLPIKNNYVKSGSSDNTVQLNGNIIKVKMHVADSADYTEAGKWIERVFTLDFASRTTATLAISGNPLTDEFVYSGDSINFISSENEQFGMFTPQEGTKAVYYDDKVKITFKPKNTTVYAGFYYEASVFHKATWDTTKYIAANSDGSFTFELPASYCGKAWPVAPVKVKDNTATTSSQYYLAIPDSSKLKSPAQQAAADAETAATKKTAAENAKTAAKNAMDAAEASKTIADNAAKMPGEAAVNAAQQALTDAETAVEAVATFKTAAETAKQAADEALASAQATGSGIAADSDAMQSYVTAVSDAAALVTEAAGLVETANANKAAADTALTAATDAKAAADKNANLANGSVTVAKASYAYTGKVLKPAITVKSFNGKTLTANTDYTVAFKNNTNVGTATVTVTGKGSYNGTKTATFKITKASNKAVAKSTTVKKSFKVSKLKKKAQTIALPKVTTTFGNAAWSMSTKDKKKVLSLKSGKIKVKKGAKKGTYTIKLKATVKGTANYAKATSKVVTVKVTVKK